MLLLLCRNFKTIRTNNSPCLITKPKKWTKKHHKRREQVSLWKNNSSKKNLDSKGHKKNRKRTNRSNSNRNSRRNNRRSNSSSLRQQSKRLKKKKCNVQKMLVKLVNKHLPKRNKKKRQRPLKLISNKKLQDLRVLWRRLQSQML